MDDVSTVARALDETFRAWTIAVSREYPGMKNVLLASSAVYVGAAWLFVLPSAVKLAVEALSAALRVALAVVTLAGAGMFCAYAATRGHSRRARRVAARLRVVKRVALGFFDADEPHDEAPRTPPRTSQSKASSRSRLTLLALLALPTLLKMARTAPAAGACPLRRCDRDCLRSCGLT